jgi:hypothetical protein
VKEKPNVLLFVGCLDVTNAAEWEYVTIFFFLNEGPLQDMLGLFQLPEAHELVQEQKA